MGIVIAIAVVIFFIVRLFIFAGKSTNQSVIKYRVKRDAAYAEDYAAGLDIPYHKKAVAGREAYDTLVKNLQGLTNIKGFVVEGVRTIDKDNVLVLSDLRYHDVSVDLRGNSRDVKRTTYHNFVVRYTENEISVLSSLYGDATDKFQKKEFADNLFLLVG